MNRMIDLEQTIKELLKNIIMRLDTCMKLIQNNQFQESIEKMIFIMDDLQVLMEGISRINEQHLNQFEIEELNEKLMSILQQIEVKDYFYLADLLEFELIPLLEYWDGCIKND